MKSWLESNTVKYLFLQWIVSFFMLLGVQMEKHSFDFWALGAITATSLAGIVARLLQSDVEAPFDWMNKKA